MFACDLQLTHGPSDIRNSCKLKGLFSYSHFHEDQWHEEGMGKGIQFDRFVMSYVLDQIEAKGLTDSEFVRRMWGDAPASWTKWCRIKGTKDGGRFQELRLADLFDISQALGKTPPDLLWNAHKLWQDGQKENRESLERKLTA